MAQGRRCVRVPQLYRVDIQLSRKILRCGGQRQSRLVVVGENTAVIEERQRHQLTATQHRGLPDDGQYTVETSALIAAGGQVVTLEAECPSCDLRSLGQVVESAVLMPTYEFVPSRG